MDESLPEVFAVQAFIQTISSIQLDNVLEPTSNPRGIFGTSNDLNRLISAKHTIDTIGKSLFIFGLTSILAWG